MKKWICLIILLNACVLFAKPTQTLQSALPLLQAPQRNAAENQQVLQLFLTAKQPDLVFSAGASLVRIPPARGQEAKLLNVLMRNSDELKKVFAAVILIAMGTQHTELSELLQEATQSADPALRAYAATAYTILNPDTNSYVQDIIQLYIYDPAFAQRAMNLLCNNEKQILSYLKSASANEDANIRAAAAAWLGDLQDKKAAKQLLSRAKKETNTEVISTLATALAKNQQYTLTDLLKGLKTKYTAPQANTYALALGFVTGNAINPIKQNLLDKNINLRINSARTAAYMAGVLASPQANRYTTDKTFDSQLLKGLIPMLSAMAKSDEAAARPYASNALKQISKLK